MGFVTGFLGGVTLTTSVLYLTLSLHQRNRLEQSLLLRQQSLILKNIMDPLPPPPPPHEREARTSVFESAKDRWNSEIENTVRKAAYTDWAAVRDQMERGLERVWDRVWPSVKEGLLSAKEEGKKLVQEGEAKVEQRVRGREG